MAWMLLQAIRPFASEALGFTWSASPPTATSRPDRTTCTGPAEIQESFTCLGQNLGLRAVLVNVAGIFTRTEAIARYLPCDMGRGDECQWARLLRRRTQRE